MKTLSTIAILVSLSACGLMGPKEDPALKAEVDGIFASPAKTANYDYREMIPWEVGQWVVFRGTDKDGKRSVHKTSIVKKEANGFWMESEHIDYSTRGRAALLIENVDPHNLKNMRVTKAKILKEDGEVIEWDASQGENPMLNTFNMSVMTIQQAESGGTAEDVVAPAGTFKGARKTNVTVEMTAVMFKVTSTGNVWYTGAVPITYYAKSDMEGKAMMVSTHNTEEVVDFGMTGAKSYFFK